MDAEAPPPGSGGSARADDAGFARIFRWPGNPMVIASGWTSIRGTSCVRPIFGWGTDPMAPGPAGCRNLAISRGHLDRCCPAVPPDDGPVTPMGPFGPAH